MEFSFIGGVPVSNYSEGLGTGNFYIGTNINKFISKSVFVGVGLYYSAIDTKPTTNFFTYDRQTIYPFFSLGNVLLSENRKWSFIPQVKLGYSFYSYSLNEFTIVKQKDNALFSGLGMDFRYGLNENLSIGLQLSYNIIFNKYRGDYNFPIPSNYIISQKNQITELTCGLSLAYKKLF